MSDIDKRPDEIYHPKLENAGTAEAKGHVLCESCDYYGDIDTYTPSYSVYSDIRCPQCSSTNNKHNQVYLERLQAAFKRT